MGETTAMKDECGPESRLIVLLLRGDEHYLTGRFPPIFGCISLHNVRFCRCIWETASAAGNFDKTTARNFKLFVVLSGRAEARPLTSATPRCRYFYSRSIGQQLDSQSVSKKRGERTLHWWQARTSRKLWLVKSSKLTLHMCLTLPTYRAQSRVPHSSFISPTSIFWNVTRSSFR